MEMKRFLIFLLVTVLAVTTLIGCVPKDEEESSEVGQAESEFQEDKTKDESKEEVELLVSAAASLTDVLEEIKEEYKRVSPETILTFTLGSSGALQAQIEEGAPVDVFMSAAQNKWIL